MHIINCYIYSQENVFKFVYILLKYIKKCVPMVCTPIDSQSDSGTWILPYNYMYFRRGESFGYKNDSNLIPLVIRVQDS